MIDLGKYAVTVLAAYGVTAALLITAAMGAMVLAHRERLTPKPTQASTAARRVRDYAESGKPLGPLPSPGVYARHNAVDTPALLPDGTPAEASVARVLAARGTVRSAPALAEDIEELQRTVGDVGSRTDPDAQGGGVAGGAGGTTDTSAGSGHNTENPEEDA